MLFEQAEERLAMAAGPLVISEFMAQNDTTLADQDGAFSDWIEIHNTSAAAVDLADWHLTDDAGKLAKWTFPSQSLAADGYLVVFASSKNRAVAGAQLHTNFSLGVNGEYLALVKPDLTVASEFTPEFPAQVADVSYGTSADQSVTGYFTTPTPGAANGAPVAALTPKVLISEIMFHPASNNDLQEWFELYNQGAATVDLNGWQIDRGITYTFPNVSVAAGQYLVVAANVVAFKALNPGVTNVVGNWMGSLADGGEEIRLVNPTGATIDSVEYRDDGAWATRTRGALDNNHQGWDWVSTADGGGKSLELVNFNLPNNYGQNWLASVPNNGSPGAANAVAATNIAPLVVDVAQSPRIPRSFDTVNVRALILDELSTGITASVQYRVDGAPNFSSVTMLDDGLHGDGAAGDHVFGATLPFQANGVVVEYYVQASDAGAHVRTWPAPVQPTNTQSANLLYQVDNTFDPLAAWTPGSQPIYRIVMTEAERAELALIGSQNPDAQSDARMNATFIAIDGTGISSSYLVGIRNRGHGSRLGTPNNYHLDFRHDDTWNGMSGAKLNARYTDSQTLGAAIFQQANLVSADTTPVQVRVNGQNLAQAGAVMYGSYVLVEEENGDFVDKHFATNRDGNLYAAFRQDAPGTQEADLRYEGNDPAAYQDTYQKQTNQEANDWADLIQLTDKLNNAPAATYFQDVSQVADLAQWAKFLALNTLLNNRESGLNTGIGDDYVLYRGTTDTRFQLLPHDLDTLMGRGNNPGNINDSIFAYTNVDGLARLFTDSSFLKLYYSSIVNLISSTFNPQVMNPLIEQTLGGFVPQATRNALQQFVVDRTAAVLLQVPRSFTITSALPVVNSYYQTNTQTTALSGTADVATTGSVRVNGLAANWDARTGAWSIAAVPLNKGINRVLVETYSDLNGTGTLVRRDFIDIWSTAVGTDVSGTLPAGTTTWTAANGPYNITATVVIPVDSTLVIEPGTSLFFAVGTQLTVNGRLDAVGTQYNQIRFTRTPAATDVWNGVQLNNSMQDNHISYAVLEWAAPTSNNGMVGLTNSQLLLENSTLDHADHRRIRTQGSNIIVRNNTFTDIFGPGVAPSTNNFSEHIWGAASSAPSGYLIIEGNSFGTTKGHNDVLDIDGGLRADGVPVLQILNNTFYGGGDDAMDFEGDAHIEGNLIMNFVRDIWNTATGNSNGLSAGDAHLVGHDYYLARNTFINVQDITTVKQNSFVRFYNNTIIDALTGAISFAPPDSPVPGKGGVFEGNIFYNANSPFLDVPALPENFVVRNNLLTADQVNLGTGNVSGDPRFVDRAKLDFHLLPGSPALRTGPNGLDMGSQVPRWASISGEPPVNTPLTTATLIVGGPSITAYKYKVNNGDWSAETPVATPISLAGLTNGTYTVYVVGKNDANVWQADAQAAASKTWTVTTTASYLMLNEILASNQSAVDLHGTRPDVIELYNGGPSAIDLADMSLTDDPLVPRKFVFPAGSTIPAGGYFVVYADLLASAPGELHTGFALSASGDSVRLYNKLSDGGLLIDNVAFGIQATDWSIGRVGQSQQWVLTQPTFGAANIAARTGNPTMLKLNEWFTGGDYVIQGNSKTNDFIELYNPDTLPVPLNGLYLSDDPIARPGRYQIPPLSFVGPGGVHPYAVFQADDDSQQGADHTDFKLSADRGWLVLSDSTLKPIDRILYGPQTDNYSQGRIPDGSSTVLFFGQPSPGVDLTAPSVPTNLRSTASNATTVDLAWDASTDADTGVLEYRLYRNNVLLQTTSALQLTQVPLVPDVANIFRVTAVNRDNVESTPSAILLVGTDTSPPSAPVGLVSGLVAPNRVDLTWSAANDPESGVSLYTIYRDGVSIGTSATTTFSDSTPPAAGTIVYRVSATNGDARESVQSAQLLVTNYQQGVYPTAAYAGTIDSWISGSAANVNTNLNSTGFVRFDGVNSTNNEDRGMIRWDLSGLPAGGLVTSASITVNVSNDSVGQQYSLYALKRNWVESEVTWNNYSANNPWQTAGADGADDRDTVVLGTAVSSALGKVTFALNAAGVAQLQQWVLAPASNFGFFITRADASVNDAMIFDSREAATLANRPMLSLSYTLSPPPPDTTPPTTPTGLGASANSQGSVVLGWNASADPESGVQNYRIYRDNVWIATSNSTSYVDSALLPGATYVYRVSAVNAQNLESAQSVPAVISTDNTAPTVPANFTAAADAGGHIALAWSASTDPESGVKLYRIFRDNLAIATSLSTSFTDLTAVSFVNYQYQVSAVNSLYLESARSAVVNALVDSSPPSTPDNVKGAIVSVTNVTLTWTASTDAQSGVQLYTVFRDGVQIGTSNTATFVDNTAQPAATTVYTVSATNGAGLVSSLSVPLSVTRFRDGASPTAAYAGTTDSWIDGSATGTNFGTSTTFRFDGVDASSQQERGLIRWDLSAVPSGNSVTGASISVNVTNASGGQFYNLYALNRSWSETQVTYNNADSGTTWATAGANGAADADLNTVLGTVSSTALGAATFQLNAAGIAKVQSWIDVPASNFGFIIVRSGGAVNDVMAVSSREAATLTDRPQFSVSYVTTATPDVTAPTVPTNLAASNDGGSQVTLTWSASTDAQSAVTGYNVYRDGIKIGSPTATSFVDTGAIPGKNYSYQVSAVNAVPLESDPTAALVYQIPLNLAGYTLTMSTRDSFLPGVPVLVQIEISGVDGRPAKEVWDAVATLSTSTPGASINVAHIQLRNGLGSALVMVNGSGPVTLTATAGGIQTQRTLNSLNNVTPTIVSGTLTGAAVSWSGVVHVVDNVTIPVGTTLTVQPGTLVLIDGNSTPLSTNGKRIIVQGQLNSLGTAAQPVTFTATDPTAPWGEITHSGSQSSLYQYTQINRAGHSSGVGHTGKGPAVRATNSTLTFDHAAITDLAGKIMYATGSNLAFSDSNLARAVMGPEIATTGLSFQRSYITEMLGKYREDGINDDDDGIYLHDQGAGKTIALADSVIALVDDDAIDTLNSTITVDRMIIRDATNPNEDAKGISVNGGSTTVRNTLIAHTALAIATKNNVGGAATTTTIDRTTIVDAPIGIAQSSGAAFIVNVSNSIIRATDAVSAEFPLSVTINYSDVSEAWPGTGNIDVDPLFVNVAKRDYHLQAASPAINTGDPAVFDVDGSRVDMGAFPRLAAAQITGRRLFYNSSKFDGNDAAAGVADDAALASGKTALLPGGTATVANYSNYSRGINGVMIDVTNLPITPTAADFSFRVGNDNSPGSWSVAPAPESVTVRALVNGPASSRITITWPDGAIKNQWLQITAKTSLGLAVPDVFYFGNAVGETGNSAGNAQVNSADEIGARSNPKTFLNPALIGDVYDFNRDGFVNATDQLLARSNNTTLAAALKLISVPAGIAEQVAAAPLAVASEIWWPSRDPAQATPQTRATDNGPTKAANVAAMQLALSGWNTDVAASRALESIESSQGLSKDACDLDDDLVDLLADELAGAL